MRLFFLREGTFTTDTTWDNVAVSNWTIIELNSGIICACLPAVRRFFKHVCSTPADSVQKKHSKSPLSGRLDSPMYALRDIEGGDSQRALAKSGQSL